MEYENLLQHCSCLNFLLNYSDGPTKLFLGSVSSKILDLTVKSFFLYIFMILEINICIVNKFIILMKEVGSVIRSYSNK